MSDLYGVPELVGKSYINRILAMFRDLASIQSDLEPPPAL